MGWENVIDCQLTKWANDPCQLENDGIEAPSQEIISLACRVALMMRDEGMPPPLRVVPNGDGGITFEREAGLLFETIEIEEDGSVERITFVDSKLASRERIL